MKPTIISLITILTFTFLQAQKKENSNGIISFDEFRNQYKRNHISIPNVDGYKVLKCDFHIHSVFSDGLVWPTIRTLEAWEEGLDAIALTDHVEHHPFSKDITTDLNRVQQIAKESAKKRNLILIKGSEITRHIPPGHFNALFIGDISDYITSREHSKDMEAIEKGVKQDAFIFWNHPGLYVDKNHESYQWISFVDKLFKKGYMQGIEVFNDFTFYEKALDWCIEKDLTVIGASDIHGLINRYYRQDNIVHRTMTLVFAKERTAVSIKEALVEGRTVAWSSKYIAGKEKYVRSLFNSCVKLQPVHNVEQRKDGKNKDYYCELENNSSLYFELELKTGDATAKIILYPHSSQIIKASGAQICQYLVTSSYIGDQKHLEVEFAIGK